MVGKEGKFVGFEECDTYKDLLSLNSRVKIDWMEDKCKSAEDHKDWLQTLIVSVRSAEGDDDNDGYSSSPEEDKDPEYQNVLALLKECGKAYVLQDEDDSLLFAKYEVEEDDYVSLDGEREEQRPRRKLRSATAKENGWTSGVNNDKHMRGLKSTPLENAKNVTRRREQAKNNKARNPEPDADYDLFIQACKIVDDYVSYKDGVIVYGKDDEKVEHHDDADGSYSDVEILDGDPFKSIVSSNPSEMNTDCYISSDVSPMGGVFRQEVISYLKRPYDSEEYDKLLHDINFRKPQLHHKELRSGRELSTQSEILAQSYLQQFSGFKERLESSSDNKPECLNLLRGFFFWLQKISLPGAFMPWLDHECLSIYPGSS